MKRYFYTESIRGEYAASDLATERRRVDSTLSGIDYKVMESQGGTWELIRITDEEGARSIGRPVGIYDTLNTGRIDLLSDEEIADVQDELARRLCHIFDELGLLPERILVVGLGNRNLTPDSLGTRAADEVKPTMHVKELDEEAFLSLECSEIAVITPGVSASTGLDAAEIIRGVARRRLPDVIRAVDAFRSRSGKRVGTTVQISDTGVHPGSGIGNHRQALNEKTLSTPIITIGIPTVTAARLFDEDEEGLDTMLVAPREIDEIAAIGGKIIGGAINQAFGISPY